MRRTTLHWLLVLLWMAIIFSLSSIPSLASNLPQTLDLVLRKFAHALEYAVLAVLVVRAVGKRSAWGLLDALLVTVTYAMTDEFHQSFVAGRAASPHDVLVDGLGALIAVLFIAWRKQKTHRSSS